jgi:hypothetical protein
MPAWGVETTLEIADSSGTPVSTFLGEHGPVRVRGTRVQGTGFRMALRADGQNLAVSGSVTDTRMAGRWYPDHVLYRFFAGGEAFGTRLDTSALAALPVNADSIVRALRHLLTTEFYDPSFTGPRWDSLWQATTHAVRHAQSDGEALRRITAALATYDHSHLHLDALPAMRVLPRDSTPRAPRRDVSWQRLPGGHGLIRIRTFLDESPHGTRALRAAFDSLRASSGLIIDLRGNPGGSIVLADELAAAVSTTAIDVGAFVLRRGYERLGAGRVSRLATASLPRLTIGDSVRASNFFALIDKLGGAAVYVTKAGGASAYTGPLAVLIDRATASTAEGMAVGLQESGRAVLIGERTAGAMLAAASRPVGQGWALTLPLADFWTIGGRRPEGVGVAPDVIVANPKRQPRDEAVRAAEAWLTARTVGTAARRGAGVDHGAGRSPRP